MKYRFVIIGVDEDHEACDLLDATCARHACVESLRTLGRMIQDDPHKVLDDGGMQVIVKDEDHLTLLHIDAVTTLSPAVSVSNRSDKLL